MSRSPAAWSALLAGRTLPAAIVDLDALDRNVDRIVAVVGGRVPIRVATKSVRHTGLLRRIVDRGRGAIVGVMPYAVREAALLAEAGFVDQLLGYPIGRAVDAERAAGLVAGGVGLRCVVDAVDQVALLAEAGRAAGIAVPVVIDVDLSWRPFGAVHLGVRRSPVRTAAVAVALADGCRHAESLPQDQVQHAGDDENRQHGRALGLGLLDPALTDVAYGVVYGRHVVPDIAPQRQRQGARALLRDALREQLVAQVGNALDELTGAEPGQLGGLDRAIDRAGQGIQPRALVGDLRGLGWPFRLGRRAQLLDLGLDVGEAWFQLLVDLRALVHDALDLPAQGAESALIV
ncbi:MAG: alanine racemase, partial [Myxococcota bacterium]